MIRAQVSHLFTQIWATIYPEEKKVVAWHYGVHYQAQVRECVQVLVVSSMTVTIL
jgi:hypothetical protein